jgi:hypothetical protein
MKPKPTQKGTSRPTPGNWQQGLQQKSDFENRWPEVLGTPLDRGAAEGAKTEDCL